MHAVWYIFILSRLSSPSPPPPPPNPTPMELQWFEETRLAGLMHHLRNWALYLQVRSNVLSSCWCFNSKWWLELSLCRLSNFRNFSFLLNPNDKKNAKTDSKEWKPYRRRFFSTKANDKKISCGFHVGVRQRDFGGNFLCGAVSTLVFRNASKVDHSFCSVAWE